MFAVGNLQRKGMVELNQNFYATIGYAFVWCMKYIAVPIVVGVAVKAITETLFQPGPDRQRKKRFK